MNIKINGEALELAESVTITKLLELQNVKMPDMVSVELNGSVRMRDTYDTTVVNDGDEVEFLYFMGGGSQ